LELINKIDLLPYVSFDLERFHRHLDAVNPGVERIMMSARTGEGIEEWCSWLLARPAPTVSSAAAAPLPGTAQAVTQPV
jgi:hydrogenase nickel incorporation protein HypB